MPTQPPNLPPTTIEYARAHPDRHEPKVFSLRIAFHVWGIALVIGMLTFLAIPKLESVLKDFKVELPLISKITLLLSRFITNGYGWIPGLILAIGLPFALTALLNINHPDPGQYRRREIGMSWLLRFFALLVFLWAVVSMFAPYIALLESVSGSGNKK